MSNFTDEKDKLQNHLEELKRKHKKIHEQIDQYHGIEVTPEIRKLKTHKLFIKDEMHRIQTKLENLGFYKNGRA